MSGFSRHRLRGVAPAAAALCAVLGGCQEDPTFRLRWRVAVAMDEATPTQIEEGSEVEGCPDDHVCPTLTNSFLCSNVGIRRTQITVFDDFGGEASRDYPCFSPGFEDPGRWVGGLALGPGTWDSRLVGLAGDGSTWCDPDLEQARNEELQAEWLADCIAEESAADEPPPELGTGEPGDPCRNPPEFRASQGRCLDETGYAVSDERTFTIQEGSVADVADLILEPPPQCEDGIDNDLDGLVDRSDPSCRRGAAREDADVSAATFDTRVSLLSHNPNATCSGLGVNRVVIRRLPGDGTGVVPELCDEVVPSDPEDPTSVSCHPFSCDDAEGGAPLTFTEVVDSGAQTLEVTLAFGAEAKTVSLVRTGTVDASRGGYLRADVDFADTDFLEPIEEPLRLLPQLSNESGEGRECNSGAVGLLDLRTLAYEIVATNAHGGPLADPPRLEDGTPLDGTPIPCPPAGLRTESLVWGGFNLNAQAVSPEGEACFEAVGYPAAPTSGDAGLPLVAIQPAPPSCIQCEDALDCAPTGFICEDGLCLRE